MHPEIGQKLYNLVINKVLRLRNFKEMPRQHPSSSKGRRKRREKEERALRMIANTNSDYDHGEFQSFNRRSDNTQCHRPC